MPKEVKLLKTTKGYLKTNELNVTWWLQLVTVHFSEFANKCMTALHIKPLLFLNQIIFIFIKLTSHPSISDKKIHFFQTYFYKFNFSLMTLSIILSVCDFHHNA